MILFTLLCLIVWRIGIHIKFPFANYDSIPSTGGGNIFGFLDVFAGGGLTQFSILSLGISPYITASIVVQMLQLDIIPAFKEWAEEGEAGREKLNRWTRYIALFIAFVQALALILGLKATSNVYLEIFQSLTHLHIYILQSYLQQVQHLHFGFQIKLQCVVLVMVLRCLSFLVLL